MEDIECMIPFLSRRKMNFRNSDAEGAGVHYLKQPAPLNKIVRCYIDVKTLRLGKTPSFELWHGVPARHAKFARCVDNGVSVRVKGKFLLAARRRRLLTSTEHVVSSDPNMSKGTLVGKLESNFLNTKFTIYDNQSPHTGAVPFNKTTSESHIRSSKCSRGGHATCFKAVANMSYEVAVGLPSYMECSLLTVPASVMDLNRSARGFAPLDFLTTALNEIDSIPSFGLGGSSKSKSPEDDSDVAGFHSRSARLRRDGPLVLKTKVPQWDAEEWSMAKFPPHPVVSGLPIDPNFLPPWEQSQSLSCPWNFQVVAVSMESNQTSSRIEEVVLTVRKCANNIYKMDYLYPLSALQAFAICLSYFDDKVIAKSSYSSWFG